MTVRSDLRASQLQAAISAAMRSDPCGLGGTGLGAELFGIETGEPPALYVRAQFRLVVGTTPRNGDAELDRLAVSQRQ